MKNESCNYCLLFSDGEITEDNKLCLLRLPQQFIEMVTAKVQENII